MTQNVGQIHDGVLYGADFVVGQMVANLLGFPPFESFAALGVVRDGTLIGGAVYTFRDEDVEVSVAFTTPRWASPRVLRRLFAFPFLQCRCVRASAITAETNLPARRILDRLGARVEGRHPHKFGRGKHAISYGLMAEDCKWLWSRHGK